MNDPSLSSVGQTCRHLEHVMHSFGHGHVATPFQKDAQVIAFDELKGDEM